MKLYSLNITCINRFNYNIYRIVTIGNIPIGWSICGTVGGMLAVLYYAVLNNRMMAYVERQLYPLPHEAPSRRSGAP